MKSIIEIIKTLILLVSIIISFAIKAQTTTEKVELNKFIIHDDNFKNILDSFIIQEPFHKNHDTVYLFIDICDYYWKIGENCQVKDTMIIRINSTANKDRYLLTGKEGFFMFKNKVGVIQGIALNSIFKETGKSMVFKYENENETKLIYRLCNVGDDFTWYFYCINNEYTYMDD